MKLKSEGAFSQRSTSRLDALKWLLVLIIILGGIVANSYYSQVAWALRATIGIILIAIAVAIASQTAQGKQAWIFLKGARAELRKVVWPSRQETIRTTLVVVGMVAIMAIILWVLDSLFLWIISWLTG